MRRGDLVSIDWRNGNGHSTFCWDVHLDAAGAVDCFLYLSANGNKNKKTAQCYGPGVSVGTVGYNGFVECDNGTWKKVPSKLFEDRIEYVQHGNWQCIPGVSKSSVDVSTFAPKAKPRITDSGPHSIAVVNVTRFWGVAPPERSQTDARYSSKFDLAKKLAYENPAESYAMGKGKNATVVSVAFPQQTPTKVTAPQAKSDPKTVDKPATKPVTQKKEHAVHHQNFVEEALAELHHADWISRGPGKTGSVATRARRRLFASFRRSSRSSLSMEFRDRSRGRRYTRSSASCALDSHIRIVRRIPSPTSTTFTGCRIMRRRARRTTSRFTGRTLI